MSAACPDKPWGGTPVTGAELLDSCTLGWPSLMYCPCASARRHAGAGIPLWQPGRVPVRRRVLPAPAAGAPRTLHPASVRVRVRVYARHFGSQGGYQYGGGYYPPPQQARWALGPYILLLLLFFDRRHRFMVCLNSGSPKAPQSSPGMQALLHSSRSALILQVCLHAMCGVA